MNLLVFTFTSWIDWQNNVWIYAKFISIVTFLRFKRKWVFFLSWNKLKKMLTNQLKRDTEWIFTLFIKHIKRNKIRA